MEPATSTPASSSPPVGPSFKVNKPVLIGVVLFVLGVGAGILAGRVMPANKGQVSNGVSNKVISQNVRSAEGKLVEKDDTSITLEKDGERLKITVPTDKAVFVDPTDTTGMIAKKLADIQTGVNLRGGIVLSKEFMEGNAGATVIGTGFTVIPEGAPTGQ